MAESPPSKIAKLNENDEFPRVPENDNPEILDPEKAPSLETENEKAPESSLNDSGCHSGSSDYGQRSTKSAEKELEPQQNSSSRNATDTTTDAANSAERRTEKGILRQDMIKRKRPLRFSSVREFLFQRKQVRNSISQFLILSTWFVNR